MKKGKTLFQSLRELIKTQGRDYVWNKYLERVKQDRWNAVISYREKTSNLTLDDSMSCLSGIPVGVKDNICTVNLPTTCGSMMLKNHQPTYDATVVEKIEACGMPVMAKLNLNEFAMGSDTNNHLKGQTLNPACEGCNEDASGSSGGSAAAVAADLVPVALGSDTGGSVRAPAGKCGVVGVKPSYGTVSRYGVFAYGCSLEQVGVLTRYVEDAAQILDVIGGRDKLDPTTIDITSDFFSKSIGESIQDLRIGLDYEVLSELSTKEQEIIHNVINSFKDLVKIVPVKLPDLNKSCSVYYSIAFAEGYSDLTRFDGVNFGEENCETVEGNMLERIQNSREKLHYRTKLSCTVGHYCAKTPLYEHQSIVEAARIYRRKICQEMKEIYKTVDCIMLPTLSNKKIFLEDKYNVISNLTGAPAVCLSAGKIDNMPWGIQILTDCYQDALMCNVASTIQHELDLTNFKLP